MKKKRARKNHKDTDRWLSFALVAAVSTFFVLAASEAIGLVSSGSVNDISAFDRGQYHFNHSGDETAYDLQKARGAYLEVLSQDAEEANGAEVQMAWYQLGRIDFLEGNFDASIRSFEHLVEEYDDPIPNVHYMLGLAHGYKAKFTGIKLEWQAAEEEFLQFLKRVPESPWGRTDLAWVYFAQGKYDEMVPILEEGLKLEPDNPWLHNMYGLALLNLGDAEAAHLAFIQAETAAGALSVAGWGMAYPGNDPRAWERGLESFREVIVKNKNLAAAAIEAD